MKTKKTPLQVKVAGIEFRNPFIVSSGPCSKSVEQIQQAEEYGWAGISVKLTMEPEPYINSFPRYRWFAEYGYHIFSLEKRLKLSEGLKLISKARKRTKKIVILANITYFGEERLKGWSDTAKKFEDAGAQAIEINFCCPNMSYNISLVDVNRKESKQIFSTGASLGLNPEAVKTVTGVIKKKVNIPVIAKLTPEGNQIVKTSQAAIEAGADGICSCCNTLGVAPFDIRSPNRSIYRLQEGMGLGCLSGPWLKPLALKNVLQIRRAVGQGPVIIGTGGVQNADDAIRMAMVGADLIGICTEVMLKGFRILPQIIKEIEEFLSQEDKNYFSEIRDEALPYLKSVDNIKAISGYAKVNSKKCVGCGRCLDIGHCYAIKMVKKKAIVKRRDCQGCSTCVDICPKKAFEIVEI